MTMRLALLLALFASTAEAGTRTLSWTMPTTTAKANSAGQLTDCSGGPPVRSLAGWRIFAQVQSRTWVEHGAAMNADSSRWAALWPLVRDEAMPRQVRSASSKHMPNGGAGLRISTDAPDSLDGMPVLIWYVVTFNDSLEVSCTSNPAVPRQQ